MPWPEGKEFRILSIDGGGICGILPAAILTKLEDRYLGDRSIGQCFDMITGTSTGGIIALGLGIGLRAKVILDLYVQHGGKVFPRPKGDFRKLRQKWRNVRNIRSYTYDPQRLHAELIKAFGKRTLGEADRRLCVPAFDGFTETFIFKTPHHKDYKLDWKEQLVTIARATAAAPTYFPIYRNGKRYFGDGGVWANNPIMVGLVDALACYQIDRRQVQILSLGCGDSEIRVNESQVQLGGLWSWRKIMSSAMHLQSQNAWGQAGLLIGRDHILRLNAPASPNDPLELDDYERAVAYFPECAKWIVDEQGDDIHRRFLNSTADPYVAFHGPRAL